MVMGMRTSTSSCNWGKNYIGKYFTILWYDDLEENPRDHPQCSKIGKKLQFQKCKKTLFAISKMAKINFCTRKQFKTTKNAIFGLFSGTKIDFFAIFEIAKNVLLYFWICTFFLILEQLCRNYIFMFYFS